MRASGSFGGAASLVFAAVPIPHLFLIMFHRIDSDLRQLDSTSRRVGCGTASLPRFRLRDGGRRSFRANAGGPASREKSIRSRCAEVIACPYFFLLDPNVGCHPAATPFWLGAAAIVLIFSFFGFLDSRLPFCSPLAMTFSLVDWQAITFGVHLAAYYRISRAHSAKHQC